MYFRPQGESIIAKIVPKMTVNIPKNIIPSMLCPPISIFKLSIFFSFFFFFLFVFNVEEPCKS